MDVSGTIAHLLAVKDESELTLIRSAAKVSAFMMSKVLRAAILDVVDEEKVQDYLHNSLNYLTRLTGYHAHCFG